jgi:hypothetical protein
MERGSGHRSARNRRASFENGQGVVFAGSRNSVTCLLARSLLLTLLQLGVLAQSVNAGQLNPVEPTSET